MRLEATYTVHVQLLAIVHVRWAMDTLTAGSPSHYSPVQARLQSLIHQWEECPESVPVSRTLGYMLHLVGVAVAWRKGSRLAEGERVIQLVEKILTHPHPLPDPVLSVSLRLTTSLLLVSPTVPDCHAHFSWLLQLLCGRGEVGGGEEKEVKEVLNCLRELAEHHPDFSSVSIAARG